MWDYVTKDLSFKMSWGEKDLGTMSAPAWVMVLLGYVASGHWTSIWPYVTKLVHTVVGG